VRWFFPADDPSTLGRAGPASPMNPPGAHPAYFKHLGTKTFCCNTFFRVFFHPPEKPSAPHCTKFFQTPLCQRRPLPWPGQASAGDRHRGGDTHSSQGCPLPREPAQHPALARGRAAALLPSCFFG